MNEEYLTTLSRSSRAISTRDNNIFQHFEELYRSFPIAKQHRRGLQGFGSDFTYSRMITRSDARDHGIPDMFIGCYLALIRLHPDLGERFNLHKEIPVVYSRYDDVRGSFVKQLSGLLKTLPPERRAVESGIYWLYTKEAPEGQVNSFSSPDCRFIQLPINADGRSWRSALYSALTDTIYATDLFNQTGSVVGEQFFGRAKLIKQLRAELGSGKISGLFGLRKTGKTSVLKELALNPESDQVVVYVDIESTSGDESPSETLSRKILQEVSRSLQREGYSSGDIARTLEQSAKEGLRITPAVLERCMSSAMTAKRNREMSLILLIDEVETLFPHNFKSIHPTAREVSIVNIFSRIRSLHQENSRFNFLVAGITASILEVAELYGASNPLFQLATPHWLPPLSPDESRDLLQVTGKRQGMNWSEQACEVAYGESGGHAMLLRKVASAVFQNQTRSEYSEITVTEDTVLDAKSVYAHGISSLASEIVDFNKKFYPVDFEILEMISGGSPFEEAKSAWPDSIQRLTALGLIEEDATGWAPSKLLGLSSYGKRLRREPTLPNLEDLLQAGETEQVEYKGSFEADLHGKDVPPKAMHWNCIKTILGFLNRDGGTLLIGVDDDGVPIGIDADLALCQNSRDKFQRRMNTILAKALGDGVYSSLRMAFVDYEQVTLCRVDVPRSDKLLFLQVDYDKGKTYELYVRRSGETKGLSGEEAFAYQSTRA